MVQPPVMVDLGTGYIGESTIRILKATALAPADRHVLLVLSSPSFEPTAAESLKLHSGHRWPWLSCLQAAALAYLVVPLLVASSPFPCLPMVPSVESAAIAYVILSP